MADTKRRKVTGEYIMNRTPVCYAGERWCAERDALLAANAELEARLAASVPRETMERACRLSYNIAANRYHGAPKDGVSDNDQPATDALIELSAKATRLLDGEERDIAACIARAEAEAAKPQADTPKEASE